MGAKPKKQFTIAMENYTRLDEKEIATILAQYDIHNISSFELLSGGSENTNYLIKSENGNYVLCICEQKPKEKAIELAELLKYLRANSFKTSKVKKSTKDQSVIMWKGKPIMVKEFLEGKTEKDLSPHLLKLIGKELALLHQIKPPDYLPKKLTIGLEQYASVKLYAANSEFDIWLQKVKEYIEPYLKSNLATSIVHSDVFWDNVIISEDESSVTIMDFEEAVVFFRVFDIGMTIIGICGEGEVVNLKKAKYLIEGYQSEITLSVDELNSLKAFTFYAAASMTYWRHQNFNFVKPDPKMANHYLGLKILADYIMEQEDDCFI